MLAKSKLLIILVGLLTLAGVEQAQALPWDVDMFRQQSLKAGEITRSPAEGTVPKGHKPFTLTVEEAAEQLTNPIPATFDSLWYGRRVWNVNCMVCHGGNGESKTVVGPKVAAPNLLDDFYKQSADGKVYGILRLGGANMPRYGYKLTEDEHWHVINYLRFLQGKVEMPGFPRPEK